MCVSLTVSASGPIKIGVISDLHFLSPRLASESDALSAYESATGRKIGEMHEVLEHVLNGLQLEKIDLLLICGDLTNHGEKESHSDLTERLQSVRQSGIKVAVVPGNHDINIPDAKSYTGAKTVPAEGISESDFVKLYAPFGYGDAFSRDSSSLSYAMTIDETTWLLCLDTSRYGEYTRSSVSGGRILPQTLQWAVDLLRKAREKGVTVLGMMHHGLVEHMPYQALFFSDYLVDGWQQRAATLADEGLRVVFTGHFHSNDITRLISPGGNPIYDVETASLAGFPFAYRIIQLEEGKLSIDTRFVTSIPSNPDLETQSRQRAAELTRKVARNRIRAIGIPLPAETESALTELLVEMHLLHLRGDERPDEALVQAIQNLAGLLDGTAGETDFQLDFPPADNRLVIELEAK